MNDLDIKTPDFYADNHGVDVAREVRFPESGQVVIRIAHNKHQSTRLQIGLAQAEELHDALGLLIAQIKATA
jgi:hypothetical protein